MPSISLDLVRLLPNTDSLLSSPILVLEMLRSPRLSQRIGESVSVLVITAMPPLMAGRKTSTCTLTSLKSFHQLLKLSSTFPQLINLSWVTLWEVTVPWILLHVTQVCTSQSPPLHLLAILPLKNLSSVAWPWSPTSRTMQKLRNMTVHEAWKLLLRCHQVLSIKVPTILSWRTLAVMRLKRLLAPKATRLSSVSKMVMTTTSHLFQPLCQSTSSSTPCTTTTDPWCFSKLFR